MSSVVSPRETQAAAPGTLVPVTMAEAVGYPTIACAHEMPVENALVLKHDRLFLVTDSRGDIVPPGRCALGLFHDDTRILSHYALAVRGGPPSLLSTDVPRAYRGQVDLAVMDLPFGGNPRDPKHAIHIRRELLLADRLIERVSLTSYLHEPLDYWLELTLGCDFADIFEVRGWHRPERGQFYAPEAGRDRLAFSYLGRDDRLLRTVVHFCRPPDELDAHRARWRCALVHGGHFEVEWEVTPEAPSLGIVVVPGTRFEELNERLAQDNEGWRSQCTHWQSDDERFDTTLSRATADLRALYTEIGGESVITAGIPWYSTVFGRDSIITSLQTLPLVPRIARDTLRYLARHQGTREDAYTEEQPGKILHELRRGEMARTAEIPFIPYYGTIDATPLWLILLHETWRWTGDAGLVRELLPNAERALAWIDRYGDLDGDGFVEYASTSATGLVNQGWKDSTDGVPFPDGRLPEPPIALVEVQGYVYDAKVRMAELFAAFGDPGRAAVLHQQAAELRRRIHEVFWLPELGTYALALDGQKTPLPTVSTNAGHLLWSRVPDPATAARLAQMLLGPDMFGGWGIRTLSAGQAVFNPMSYHDGSVWPHDNGLVCLGLALYGHARAVQPVMRALHEAAMQNSPQRLPELFCGLPRSRGEQPVRYPVSCSPQAWASGALFMFLQAMLGLYPEAPARVLHVRDPVLPDFLTELTVSNLAVGGSRVSLQFRRHGERTLCNLLALEGEPLQVRLEFG